MSIKTILGKWQAWFVRVWPLGKHLLMLIVFLAALALLYHESRALKAVEVAESFRSLPALAVLAAVLLTFANYAVLVGYDWIGTRIIAHPLPLRQVAMTAVISYAFSNSLGTLLGGTPIRARLYSAYGLGAAEIVRLVFMITLTFWIGLFVTAGLLLVATPFPIPEKLHLPLVNSRPLGAVLLLLSAIYFALCAFWKAPLSFSGVNLRPPSLSAALMQTLIAMADLMLASATLYVLLPDDTSVSFLSFTAIFLLAIIASLVSNIPGGLGVLEAVVVSMLPSSSHSLFASLLAFRVIYYLLPLFLSLLGLSVSAVRQHGQRASRVARSALVWTQVISPRVITGAVFLAGMLLLISGSLPAAQGRMNLVRHAIPLPVVEFSHFVGSVIGGLLIALARGLQRRIDAAWWLTLILLGLGSIASLLKGLDYEEAILLGCLFLALLSCRQQFHRRGRLLEPSIGYAWALTLAMAVGLLLWVMLFAYRHVEYSHELWWQFTYHGDAPRSLRALLGLAVVLSLTAVMNLMQPHAKPPEQPSGHELEAVVKIVSQSRHTNANLALLGDKRFVFSDDRGAFVMFGCQGNSWIAMGDAVGPRESGDDASWRFREACDVAGAWPVFYQADERCLGRYVEMGLSMLKLGEEARVPLDNFSLDGGARKDLRKAMRKANDLGLSFEVVGSSQWSEQAPRLREISDAWLTQKSTAEKGFSLGFFDEAYLSRYDMALIRQQDQTIAFANLWRGADREELSIDLMRYLPSAPHGVMEYLFTELMLYGHREGYHWFNLGMAPLSGVDAHRLGPLWNRLSNLLFRHGEHFYNFQGLRNYKDKFQPEWTAKYLASPGGVALPVILANLTSLISGGLVKTIAKGK